MQRKRADGLLLGTALGPLLLASLLATCSGCSGGAEERPPPPPAEKPAPAATVAAEGSVARWQRFAEALAQPDALAAAEVRSLIGRGFDPASLGPGGERALVLAAGRGALEVVRVLLREAKVDPDQREALRGETALIAAARERHGDVVLALLEGGADPTLVAGIYEGDHPFRTARSLAEEAGDKAMAAKLNWAAKERSHDQGMLFFVQSATFVPPPGGCSPPVSITFPGPGEQGGLEQVVADEEVYLSPDEGSSIVDGRTNANLYRIPLHWKQGDATGRADVLLNHRNGGEESQRAMGGVTEIWLPDGRRVRVELELLPHPVE